VTIHLFWFTKPTDNKYDKYQFSNQEIQKNFLVEFSKYDQVIWHDSNARGRVTSSPDDILIGHPPWPAPADPHGNWVFDNGLDGPGSAHPNAFIVYPWAAAHVSHPATDPYVPMLLASRALFGMGGTLHYDKNVAEAAPDTVWRRTQSKLVRINMGCDARFLPFRQNADKRPAGLLHVSSLMGYKRPEHMLNSLPPEGCTLFIGTKQGANVQKLADKGLIGRNVRVIGEVKNDDDATNRFILQNCAFYLHCAREPQATVILENAARGLVPLVTARSGFSCPDAIYLSEDDAEENQRIVSAALAMHDDEYAARSNGVRRHIRMYHAWDRICQNMYVAIRALMSGQDVDRRGDEYS